MDVAAVVLGASVAVATLIARSRRRGRAVVRLLIEPYRNDRAGGESLAATFTALHALLGPRRTLSLEVHLDRRRGGAPLVWFSLLCPAGLERQLQAALRSSYPSLRLRPLRWAPAEPPVALALRRRTPPRPDEEEVEQPPRIEAVLAAMAAAGAPATLRLSLRPASRALERLCSTPERAIGPLLWGAPVVLARDSAGACAVASALCSGTPRLKARRGHAGGVCARQTIAAGPLPPG